MYSALLSTSPVSEHGHVIGDATTSSSYVSNSVLFTYSALDR